MAVVIAVAAVFSACKQENEEPGKNQVIYDGTAFEIKEAHGGYLSSGVGELGGAAGYRFSFYFGNEFHCVPRVIGTCKGKKIDLTKSSAGVFYSFDINGNDNAIDIHQYVDSDGSLSGILFDVHYEKESIFKSGTMTVDDKDGYITFKMDAVTKNDKSLKINLRFEQSSEF